MRTITVVAAVALLIAPAVVFAQNVGTHSDRPRVDIASSETSDASNSRAKHIDFYNAQEAKAEDEKKDDFSQTFTAPIEEVYRASVQVAAGKWNVTHSDKDSFLVSFKTGANMRTWRGFEMSAICIDAGDGKTLVQLHAQKRPTAQLFSWKEGNRVASTFFKELTKRLAK
jgi:hypothetical protein